MSNSERTMMIPALEVSRRPSGGGSGGNKGGSGGRSWRAFRFDNLERVSKNHATLLKRLEWILPNVRATGEVGEAVQKRLKEMLEEDASLSVEYATVVPSANLKRYVGDPTFLAVLAPQPNKTRGLLEVELGLAHMCIDLLLGGSGEAVALRPLTDIEEGVVTWLIIETLKALAPSVDPALPKLRIEGLARSFDDAAAVVGEDEALAVVQLKAQFGPHSGYVRLFIPESVLAATNPPPDAEVRRARAAADAAAHLSRLKNVRTWLRAEIGQVEISSADLAQLRERDVVLVDQLSCRPDQGQGGAARLRVGLGRVGHIDAEVLVEAGRYKAKVNALVIGTPPPPGPPSDEAPPEGDEAAAEGEEGEAAPEVGDDDAEEMTNPAGATMNAMRESMENNESVEMLNDIPLQISVELGRVPVSAEEVVGLKVGHVFDLNRVPGEPLDLSVNGKIVARGELVEIEGNLGVRILSLAG